MRDLRQDSGIKRLRPRCANQRDLRHEEKGLQQRRLQATVQDRQYRREKYRRQRPILPNTENTQDQQIKPKVKLTRNRRASKEDL